MRSEPTEVVASPARLPETAVAADRHDAHSAIHAGPSAPIGAGRPEVRGKFLFAGEQKLHVRGVTYGTFRPREDGSEYPPPLAVEWDFTLMAAHGLNAVRTYTVPPPWLLDAAARHGLRVLVGIPVERHVGYLTDRQGAPDVARVVRVGVAQCAGHPAVLGYAIGNEIPAPVARWHGRRTIERYLERLYLAARTEDPTGLVTYVNYPSTEYLQLDFLDFVCFNVFLESPRALAAYLARLHHRAGDRPLLLSEVGLDSLRNGEETQASVLARQIPAAFTGGCAGVFVYAWTDEWHRAGEDVHDWAFGLTRTDRRAKPALSAVQSAFAHPLSNGAGPRRWPRISVVVCTYNGSRTIRDCMEGLRRLAYPDFEVIVVDDGSTDGTAEIVRSYDVRLIQTENRGLSSARNTGWQAASGKIIAYLDDDAYPDPDWLTHLALAFDGGTDVGVGGPNVSPPDDGPIAACVAQAPGNPVHVMLSDREAEHIPGCNMAFRRSALEAVGGFDTQFRVAGDDVDICWQLRDRGWTLGFSPAALVWHHRRNSVRTYWKQQVGYGRAEGLLERKWPEKYTATGQIAWAGRLYGAGRVFPAPWRSGRIYHGLWGFAPYQLLYEPDPTFIGALAHAPEWYLLIAALAVVAALGIAWRPLLLAVPLLGLALLPLGIRAVAAMRAAFPRSGVESSTSRRLLTAWLHLVHPVARLYGRLTRPRGRRANRAWPRPQVTSRWYEQWRDPAVRLHAFERAMRAGGLAVQRGGDFDRWDLQVRGGPLGVARLLMAVEEHGGGRQLVRLRWWPRPATVGPMLVILLGGLAGLAAADGAWLPGATLAAAALWSLWRTVTDCATATGAVVRAVAHADGETP